MVEYEPITLGLNTYRHLASRKEALAVHERLMSCRYERIEQLQRVLADTGQDLRLDASCLQMLNDWFATQVELRDRTERERQEDNEANLARAARHGIPPGPDPAPQKRLTVHTESVCIDCALFIGEVAIKEAPHLHWTMVTRPKSDAAYHKTVLTGFRNACAKEYHVDIEGGLVAYSHSVATGEPRVVRPTRDYQKAGEPPFWNINKFVHIYEACLRIA